MLYMILGRDQAESLEARKACRQQHIDRIDALQDQGRLILAGPLPSIDAADPGPAGYSGSLIVAEFDCLEDAAHWASEDPYLESGAWQDVDVRPWIQVRP